MTQRTQVHRKAALATPLGDDKLLFRVLRGTDTLSRLFSYEVDAFSENGPVDPEQLLGQNATVRYETRHGTRYYNGFISQVRLLESVGSMAQYRLTLVPWLWFLTRAADCRIFQSKSVPDIIRDVFQGKNFSDFKLSLAGSYPSRDYTVQYRETDFNFVSRLMEQEGIYYYFEHENGKHTMVLTDAAQPPSPCPLANSVLYQPPGPVVRQEHLQVWSIQHAVQTGHYALTDYNFIKPHDNLLTKRQSQHTHPGSDLEIFDYPGDYDKTGDGDRYVRVRLEEVQADYETYSGSGDTAYMALGHTFKLVGHPDKAMGSKEFLITSLSHEIHLDEYVAGRAGGTGLQYRCSLTALDSQTPFVPARVTPRPVIQGPQTAFVVGPAGEEIWTDEHARVKVLFHWDYLAAADEKASCWVRVSQVWAGKQWGGMFIPRVGQEVIVEFLEGDPDRPLITGRVYNGDATPPYALPDHKTMTTLKSLSSKGGGGFNEIRFEDKKGEEQIFIHGEKNIDIRIKERRFENIGKSRHLDVGTNKYEHVGNKRHETVDNDHIEEIKNDRNLKVGGKEAKEVVGSQSLKVTGAVAEEFKDSHSEVTTKDYFLQADNIVIEGKTHITIKVGKNAIVIEKSGISILCQESAAVLEAKSTGDTKIESQMNANIKADKNAEFKAGANATLDGGSATAVKGGSTVDIGSPSTTVSGDSMTTVKGGVVMIN